MTVQGVTQAVQNRGIEFFLCSFVEMSGAPKAKVVPATHMEEMAQEGAGFAGFAAGEIGQGPHSPDMAAIPDFNSLTVLPWRKNIAWVAGDVYVQGQEWDYCPRTILRRQLARAREKGLVYHTGVEPEFMLLKRNGHAEFAPYDEMDTLGKPCYDLRALHRNLDLMTTLLKYMQELGWKPYANDHEDANCQFEINWLYADALTTADRLTFFRWMVRTIAEQFGLTATFMPKPFSNLTGNGCHFHQSLADAETGQNLFLDERNENGLSEMAYHFVGGLMAHAKALAAVTNPIVNSYKRLKRGAPRSGATWAPVYITYGGSNRTQMIRIPGPGRIEHRAADGAANPYLAAAVLLAAGLDGIENRMDPGPRNDDNLYEVPEEELKRRQIGFLPTNLSEALDALEQDAVVREALGETYADYYVGVKRDEWKQYHETVSPWEIENYLGVY
ncbi:MAG TPA: type III glutamate--ammonia ligase [Chthonomonadaceae bacterium]|nr:type III glutamate--ammonia ligase [Chthonomonadaceae bacterium]